MRAILAVLVMLPGPAFSAMYGTPETCRGDFDASEVPVLVINDRLHEPDAVCTFDGHCADAFGKTWVDAVVVTISGDSATVTYEDGDVTLRRCE